MPRYSPAIEAQMRMFYQSLGEKDRRGYDAIEARKLGRGGLSYIARILNCDRHTIAQGMQEITDPEAMNERVSVAPVVAARRVTSGSPRWTWPFSRCWRTPGRFTHERCRQVDQPHAPGDCRPLGRRSWHRGQCHGC